MIVGADLTPTLLESRVGAESMTGRRHVEPTLEAAAARQSRGYSSDMTHRIDWSYQRRG